MATVRFSKEEFESALPRQKGTDLPLWAYAGYHDGEHTYRVPVKEGVAIQIRSSVKGDGFAAPSGDDSIRCWLVEPKNGNPLGNKLQAWVTRIPGWEERLVKTLRELYRKGLEINGCPKCGEPMASFTVKKEGKNKGRQFRKCTNCGEFQWADQNITTSTPAPPPVLEMADGNKVREWLDAIPTVKGRVQFLKEAIGKDNATAVWALMEIYANQTQMEQVTQSTREWNGVGFSAFDAEILSSFATQYHNRKTLSVKQLDLARRKMAAYAGQLEKQLRA